MKTLYLTTILFALFIGSFSVFVLLDSRKDLCIYKRLSENQKLNVNYISSGTNEEQVQLEIFSPSQEKIKSVKDEREGNIDIVATAEGSYKICWKALDNDEKFISFDLTVGEKTDKKVASTENIDQVGGEVRKAYKSLEQIYRNQHYQHTREEVHREAIGSLETKIKWCAFFKIFVLVFIAVIQIYILTGFFKRKTEFIV